MKAQFQPIHNNAECEAIIKGSYQGVLAMCSDDEPYAVPMNHAYENGFLYFHCAPTGLKLDVIRDNPAVVYVITKYWGTPENFRDSEKCHGQWESVVIQGTASVIEDRAELRDAFARFMRYHGKENYEPTERVYETTRAIVIEVECMTARRENAQKKTDYFLWKKDLS